MSDHEHGNMDVQDHEKTFEGFIKASIWIASISIGVLIFLALFNS